MRHSKSERKKTSKTQKTFYFFPHFSQTLRDMRKFFHIEYVFASTSIPVTSTSLIGIFAAAFFSYFLIYYISQTKMKVFSAALLALVASNAAAFAPSRE